MGPRAFQAAGTAVRENNYPVIALAGVLIGGLVMAAMLGLVQLLTRL
jgi:hypothetical protein